MMGLTGNFGGPRRGFGPRRIEGSKPPADDDGLAEIRQAFTREPGAAPVPESCPSPETLWSALHGELRADEARRVVDHTALCAACAEDWRMAWELEHRARPTAAGGGALAGGRRARIQSWRQWAVGTAAAASLAASIGVFQWAGYEGEQIAQEVARAGMRGEMQGRIHSLVPKGAVLPRSRCLLLWQAVPEASSYDVVVTTDDPLQVVARAKGLRKPEFPIPESQLAELASGAAIEWQVTAKLQDGRIVSSSITFVHRLQ